MITSWNVSYNLPTTLAESISGYNKHTNIIWVVGGFNGTVKTHKLWKFNVSTNEFTEEHYANKHSYTAESYTSKDEYIYFTNNYTLYEFSMTSNPKFDPENVLLSSHYADRPSITTDQRYLFLTGGLENGQIVNKLSIYSVDENKWINIETPNMTFSRMGHNCIARNNYLYIFGGFINDNLSTATNRIEKLYINNINTINEESWELLNNTLDDAIAYMRIAEVNGLIYIIGGYSSDTQSSVNTVNVLDPKTDEIVSAVNLTYSTYKPAVTVDSLNGQIYIFGGHSSLESDDALNITQRSNKMVSLSSNNNILWFEILIFAIIGVAVVMAIGIGYKCYTFYKRRQTLMLEGHDNRIIDFSDCYGAAEGMNEGGRYRIDSKNKVVGGSVVDTSSFEAID